MDTYSPYTRVPEGRPSPPRVMPPPPVRPAPIRPGPASAPAPARTSRRWTRILIWVALAALALALLWYGVLRPAPRQAEAPPPAIPVTMGQAELGDVGLTLAGIGNVQAYNAVSIRARVDGQVMTIAFTEGQDVKPGDLLAEIDPRPFEAQLALAKAAKAKDEALLANAELDLQRYQSLARPGFATRQSVDTQAATVAQLKASIQGDQANIDAAQVQLGYTRITAPIGGRTGVRLVDQGNIVHASDNTGIVSITQIEPISVLFTLPEDSLAQVRRAMAAGAPLKVTAYDRGETQVLGEGALALVNNQIDQTTGTVQLKATFPNKDHALWPGQFVNVRVLYAARPRAVLVPTQAIQRGPSGPFVYRVKPDDTVEMVPVKTAETEGARTIIAEGLAAGDRLVVDGALKIRIGTKVQASQPQQAGAAQPAPPAGAGK